MLHFPRGENCEVVYCNIEGIAFVTDRLLAAGAAFVCLYYNYLSPWGVQSFLWASCGLLLLFVCLLFMSHTSITLFLSVSFCLYLRLLFICLLRFLSSFYLFSAVSVSLSFSLSLQTLLLFVCYLHFLLLPVSLSICLFPHAINNILFLLFCLLGWGSVSLFAFLSVVMFLVVSSHCLSPLVFLACLCLLLLLSPFAALFFCCCLLLLQSPFAAVSFVSAVSDKMKRWQDYRCYAKGESVHLFTLPSAI